MSATCANERLSAGEQPLKRMELCKAGDDVPVNTTIMRKASLPTCELSTLNVVYSHWKPHKKSSRAGKPTTLPKQEQEAPPCKACGSRTREPDVPEREAVLLRCDHPDCNNSWHTACLEPPLDAAPEGLWWCPECSQKAWDAVVCCSCGSPEKEEVLILCDNTECNACWHTYCLQPPLEEVPEGEWLCPRCSESKAAWDTVVCRCCGSPDNEEVLMLCDNTHCNASWHTFCLDPPLAGVPEDDWLCPDCSSASKKDHVTGVTTHIVSTGLTIALPSTKKRPDNRRLTVAVCSKPDREPVVYAHAREATGYVLNASKADEWLGLNSLAAQLGKICKREGQERLKLESLLLSRYFIASGMPQSAKTLTLDPVGVIKELVQFSVELLADKERVAAEGRLKKWEDAINKAAKKVLGASKGTEPRAKRRKTAKAGTTPTKAPVEAVTAALAPQDNMTEYERERQLQILKNRERLMSLQLQTIVNNIAPPPPEAKKKPTLKKRGPPAAPERQSIRFTAENVRPRRPGVDFQSDYGNEDTDAAFLEVLKAASSTLEGGMKEKDDKERMYEQLALAEEDIFKSPMQGAVSFDFHPSANSQILAAGDSRGKLCFWNLSQQSSGQDEDEIEDREPMVFSVLDSAVKGLKWVDRGGSPNKLVAVGENGSVKVLDVQAGRFDQVMRQMTAPIRGLQGNKLQNACVSDNGNILFVMKTRHHLRMIDLRERKWIDNSLKLHDGEAKINTIDLEPSGQRLVAAALSSGHVHVADLRYTSAGSPPHLTSLCIEECGASCESAYWAPDGSHRLLTSSTEQPVAIWNDPTWTRAQARKGRQPPQSFQMNLQQVLTDCIAEYGHYMGSGGMGARAIWGADGKTILCPQAGEVQKQATVDAAPVASANPMNPLAYGAGPLSPNMDDPAATFPPFTSAPADEYMNDYEQQRAQNILNIQNALASAGLQSALQSTQQQAKPQLPRLNTVAVFRDDGQKQGSLQSPHIEASVLQLCVHPTQAIVAATTPYRWLHIFR